MMRAALGDPVQWSNNRQQHSTMSSDGSSRQRSSTPNYNNQGKRISFSKTSQQAFIEEDPHPHSFCDGDTHPLESNRTTDLALECWNLRKTILEQSGQTLKYRKELKSSKNLIRNLQKVTAEVEAESLAKTKDITNKKTKIVQLEKKIHELTSTNTFINSSFTRNKRVTATLQDKVTDLHRQLKEWKDKYTVATDQLKDELKSQESALTLEIRKVSEERDKYGRELSVQASFMEEATARIAEFEGITDELKDQNASQATQFNADLAHLTEEQEKAYDLLHGKLEDISTQRDELCRKLVEQEHENHQLMSFILMEGLQVPELTPPTKEQYAAAQHKLVRRQNSAKGSWRSGSGGLQGSDFQGNINYGEEEDDEDDFDDVEEYYDEY